ncbi:hypothetical protein K1T71_012287 [Dendrolimus kikuchii]|uniref:Uncharacterized protein n=1 Tax=Dendrolimus kikuchii TaxID=765133 RepID=A0ACC1CLK0_9NEOP|nr:hypothetical protein K1T71_012287 [Dendrolimus kikuchii]
MSSTAFRLSEYKDVKLNQYTGSTSIMQYIEYCAINEGVGASHSFHKIMVNDWSDENEELFDAVSDHFDSSLIPVNATNVANMASFYTSNLNLILKIMKLGFKLPFARDMYEIKIVFNEKTSKHLFGKQVTLEDIVSGVVNRRFNENQELDLSSFRNDKEFSEHKIDFYKISLLAHFKTLMLRMGKETKSLNLSQNKLSKVPTVILNFFIKGDLTSINLSYNKIQSLSDLARVSSKIEKLWIQGNPLCDDIEPSYYVKNLIVKFPRLTQLDGIKLNEHGMIPMVRNYLITPDTCTKLVVERFLIMFFTLYDDKKLYKKSTQMYDENATFSLMTDMTEVEERQLGYQYANNSRNILDPHKKKITNTNKRIYNNLASIKNVLAIAPKTLHDPHTFTVDVLQHNQQTLILVVDGIFKEYALGQRPEAFFKFRRTFILAIFPEGGDNRVYSIMNDMLYVGFASQEQIKSSFKSPIINHNSVGLINPTRADIDALLKIFMNVTHLIRNEAELRLKLHNWDVNEATKEYMTQVSNNQIPKSSLIDEEDDFSDTSSLLDYVD